MVQEIDYNKFEKSFEIFGYLLQECYELCESENENWFISHTNYIQSIFDIIVERDLEGKLISFLVVTNVYGVYTIYFALVKKEYRNKGLLKNMLSCLPENQDILVEVYNNSDVIWKKLGWCKYNKYLIKSN